MDYNGCGSPSLNPSIHVGVFEPDSCVAWQTCSGNNSYNFNQFNQCAVCRNRPELFFIFQINDTVSMAYLDTMLSSSFLNGKNLLVYSYNCVDFNFLNTNYPNTIQIFQNLGFITAPLIDSILPFIYYTEVGNLSTAVEVYGQNSNDHITLEVLVQNCGSTLGLNDNNETKANIYPTIIQNGEVLNVEYDILNLYDISGKQVLSLSNSGSKLLIEKMKTGMYFIHLKKGSQERIEKIMITD